MKKIIVALLIALIIPSCIFAGRGLFDLTVGAVASSNYKAGDFKDFKAEVVDKFSFDRLSWGAFVEAKAAIVSVDAKALYNPELKTISGTVSANVALDILFVRAKAGLAYNYAYLLGTKAYAFGNAAGSVSDFADFKKASFDINVGADILLGNLTIGAYATLPTAVSIEKGNWNELFSTAKDNWENATIGLTVGYALF